MRLGPHHNRIRRGCHDRAPPSLPAYGVGVVSQAIVVMAAGGFVSRIDALHHSWPARVPLRAVPALYNPTPEIFVERTTHREEPPLTMGPENSPREHIPNTPSAAAVPEQPRLHQPRQLALRLRT
jgi:hypothetical protein